MASSQQQRSIGQRVLVLFSFVVVLFALCGGFALYELRGTQTVSDRILGVDVQQRRLVDTLHTEFLEFQVAEIRYLEKADAKDLEECRRLLEAATGTLGTLRGQDGGGALIAIGASIASDIKVFDKKVALVSGQAPASASELRDLSATSDGLEKAINAGLVQLASQQATETELEIKDIATGFQAATWALALLCLVVLGSLAAIYLGVRDVVSSIREITAAATEISEQGALDRQVSQRSNDEIGQLAAAFNKMVQSTRSMVVQLREATEGLAASGTQIVAATSQQSASATEQAASTAEATTTIEEIRQTADQAAERAREMIATAERSEQISKTGALAVEQSIAGVNEVRARVNSIATNILALSERTQQIGDIIATVNELAERSNLLAINAAIEAAKAAEHGKGFAVVATEVRNLASQSKLATKEVRTILGEIQKATNNAVMVTEEGAKRSDVVVRQAEQAGANIRELAQVIQATAQAARQIASSSRQQAGGIDQIVLAFRHINEATQQTVSGARETETGALGLKELADRLNKLVAPYRT